MHVNALLVLAPLTLWLGACGASTPSLETPSISAPFAVHEWGLIDAFTDGAVEIGAGPGVPAVQAFVRKPVVYFHLDEDIAQLDVRVDVRLRGALVESWPTLSRRDRSAFGWDARLSHCGPQAHSAATDLTVLTVRTSCTAIDGYCEVADLPTYETTDASCVAVGEDQGRLLFYRGSLSEPALPLSVTDNVVSITSVLPANVYFVRDGQGLVLHPTPDAPMALPTTGGVDVHTLIEGFTRDLQVEGLSTDEARAFMAAWSESLFVDEGATRGTRRFVRDVRAESLLLYFLPRADIERLAPMTVVPTPRTLERVMVVRQHIAL